MNLAIDIRSSVLTADLQDKCDDMDTVIELVYERQRAVVAAAAEARYASGQVRVTLRDVEGADGTVISMYSGFTAGFTLTGGDFSILMSNGDRVKVVTDEGVDIFEENEDGVMVFPAQPWTRTESSSLNNQEPVVKRLPDVPAAGYYRAF